MASSALNLDVARQQSNLLGSPQQEPQLLLWWLPPNDPVLSRHIVYPVGEIKHPNFHAFVQVDAISQTQIRPGAFAIVLADLLALGSSLTTEEQRDREQTFAPISIGDTVS